MRRVAADAVEAGELAVTVPTDVAVERPKNKQHGDYATGLALQLAKVDKTVPGVQKYKETRKHVAGTVNYPQSPPAGGDHNDTPQTCAGGRSGR